MVDIDLLAIAAILIIELTAINITMIVLLLVLITSMSSAILILVATSPLLLFTIRPIIGGRSSSTTHLNNYRLNFEATKMG